MGDDRLWLLEAGSHEKCRPIHGMKTQDVFAYEMQRRPEFFKANRPVLLFVSKSDGGDVVD